MWIFNPILFKQILKANRRKKKTQSSVSKIFFWNFEYLCYGKKFLQDFSTNFLSMAFYAKFLLSLPLQTLSLKPLSTVVSEGCLLKAFSAVVSAGCLCRLFLWLCPQAISEGSILVRCSFNSFISLFFKKLEWEYLKCN